MTKQARYTIRVALIVALGGLPIVWTLLKVDRHGARATYLNATVQDV